MAALPAQDISDISAEIQRTPECPRTLTKPQLRAVIEAMDAWWDTTGAALANQAIPQPQRGLLNSRQKAFLFQRMLERRYKVS